MKKLFVAVSIVMFVTAGFALNLMAGQNLEGSHAWNKLGAGVQKEYLDAKKSGDMDRRIDVFVRCQVPVDHGDQSFLTSKGLYIMMFAGPTARGYLKARDLKGVIELPFVMKVNLAEKK